MFANFFKIAFRNILRQKIYTVINVIGLSIGIAAFILISLWIIDELSYENMHDKADQTILVHKSFTMGDSYEVNPSTPYLLGPTAKDEIPEVIESVRVMRQSAVVNYEDLYFTENSICATDPSYFTVFNFEFLVGDPQHSLENPNSIVITKSVAQKYFGDDDPLGKVLWFDKEEQFVVSAVIGDIPDNTNLRSNMIVPIETMCANKDYASNWYDHFLSTYLLITPTISKQDINQKLTDHIRKYMEEDSKIELVGQPLSRLHLYNLDGKNERIQYVFIFSIIGFLILGIACINYMNISTSLSVRRSREIGLKKVVGAEKSQLVLQFLGESFLQTLAGLFIAMMLVELARPYFNDLAAKSIYIPYLSIWFLPSLFLLLILTTLIAGSYPAFLLSSFKPVHVFRAKAATGKGQAAFRKGLVIFQFAISIGLIISTLMIYSQLKYVNNKNLGFEKENVIYLGLTDGINKKFDSFRANILKNPGIVNLSRSSSLPSAVWNIMRGLEWEGMEPGQHVAFSFLATDFDFIETINLELVDGRGFSREYGTDSVNFIFNQKAIELMGYTENPTGRPFGLDDQPEGKIIGVIKNFNSLPLTYEIEPMMILIYPDYFRYILIRIHPDNFQETIDHIETVWKSYAPDFPFDYHFLDQRIERDYQNESRIGKLALAFTILAILITCIGLFGLASHTAQQKTREIGIRKVFGASAQTIVVMFVKDFTKWVLISNIIAWPVAWYFMNGWLKNFAYRIDINWLIFVIAALAALAITTITVIYQSIVAARKNPVDSLRWE